MFVCEEPDESEPGKSIHAVACVDEGANDGAGEDGAAACARSGGVASR